MPTIEQTVVIDAAPETVWTVATDPVRFGEWLSMHDSWRGEVPTDFGLGTQSTAVLRLLGMPQTVNWTVTGYEPPRSVRLHGLALIGVEVTIDLVVAPVAERRASLSATIALEGAVLTGAIATAIENAVRAELATSTASLVALIES